MRGCLDIADNAISSHQSDVCFARIDPDDSPTFDPGETDGQADSACVPALSIVAHPEVRRLGESARLYPILLRRPVALARTCPEFDTAGRRSIPLLDTSVSRTPLILTAGSEDGSMILDPGGATIHVDGDVVRKPLPLSRQRIAHGVQLRLSSRVGLLLHFLPEQREWQDDLGMIGASCAMSALRRTIERTAPSNAAVLILGESGTGKELVAQAIHRLGLRSDGPMIAVNMATLTDGTAASHLFGHKRGAFTGAEGPHCGFFELAHGGSLFLDEVADATPAVQAMLLRVLESSKIVPLGSEKERAVDVRILAATELDLFNDTRRGSFRSSLTQRLSGVILRVPPLRERREDIPCLLRHFLSILDVPRADYWLSGSMRDSEPRLSADFMFRMIDHTFPGNVRELRNVAQHLLSLGHPPNRFGRNAEQRSDLLKSGLISSSHEERLTKFTVSEEQLRRALAENDWSPARAARALGVANSTIHYWMKQKRVARRASEVSDDELRAVAGQMNGDIDAMSRALAVSARGLRLRLRGLKARS